eukprot:g1863.t1
MSRQKRSRHDLFRAHLVNVANIVQLQEYHEQKKQRKYSKEMRKSKEREPRRDAKRQQSSILPAAVGFGTGGSWSELVTIVPASIQEEQAKNSSTDSHLDMDLLTKINVRVFGRVSGAFQQLSEMDDSDQSEGSELTDDETDDSADETADRAIGEEEEAKEPEKPIRKSKKSKW